jgi:hypothetical protein
VSSVAVAASARRDRAISDFLFIAQVACAFAFGIAQFVAMQRSIVGVSITWIGLWLAFLLVNLVLALNARRAHDDRVMRQTVVMYAIWTGVSVIILAQLLLLGAHWNVVDSLTACLTLGGVVGAIVAARLRGLAVSDPLVRAAFAVFFKAVPQLTLAWNILRDGGQGVAAFAIAAGHVMITMRLGQVWFSSRVVGWDRNRIGLAIGEAANELSWIVTTIAWLIMA